MRGIYYSRGNAFSETLKWWWVWRVNLRDMLASNPCGTLAQASQNPCEQQPWRGGNREEFSSMQRKLLSPCVDSFEGSVGDSSLGSGYILFAVLMVQYGFAFGNTFLTGQICSLHLLNSLQTTFYAAEPTMVGDAVERARGETWLQFMRCKVPSIQIILILHCSEKSNGPFVHLCWTTCFLNDLVVIPKKSEPQPPVYFLWRTLRWRISWCMVWGSQWEHIWSRDSSYKTWSLTGRFPGGMPSHSHEYCPSSPRGVAGSSYLVNLANLLIHRESWDCTADAQGPRN